MRKKNYLCYLGLQNIELEKIHKAIEKSMGTVYKDISNIPENTSIRLKYISSGPVLIIEGEGPDNRCSFCNYFTKIMGEKNINRDCFLKRDRRNTAHSFETTKLTKDLNYDVFQRTTDGRKNKSFTYKLEGDKKISESYAIPTKDSFYFSEEARRLRKNRND